MAFRDRGGQPVRHYVGVYLGRGDVFMAKHGLYGAQVRAAKGILKGHIGPIVAGLRKKMAEAAGPARRDFETAAKYRDEIRSLQSTCAGGGGTGKIKGTKGRSK